MGWFVHFKGNLKCIRCGLSEETLFQTKLLRSDAETCFNTYEVGDTEEIDGLEDFLPLNPWPGISPLTSWLGEMPLVVVAGEWDCRCGLSPQWAKVTFGVKRRSGDLYGTIKDISALVPDRESLKDVHYVEYMLAQFADFWPSGNWQAGQQRWNSESIESRRLAIEDGFRKWYREVANVNH